MATCQTFDDEKGTEQPQSSEKYRVLAQPEVNTASLMISTHAGPPISAPEPSGNSPILDQDGAIVKVARETCRA